MGCDGAITGWRAILTIVQVRRALGLVLAMAVPYACASGAPDGDTGSDDPASGATAESAGSTAKLDGGTDGSAGKPSDGGAGSTVSGHDGGGVDASAFPEAGTHAGSGGASGERSDER